MIAIVRIALSRPLTFIVLAIAILLFGTIEALRVPVDIFPDIGIPVVATAWSYNGLSPLEMEGRVISPFERTLTTTVNDIEHIESQSMPGIGVVKIYFHPGVNISTATAQVTAISQYILRQLPSGITPPLVLNYSASTVPILQLAVGGTGLSEQKLFDLALNQMRPGLVTVPGAASPFPSGGKQRQIQVDIDPASLQSKGLSAEDVGDAIVNQNQINPVGFAKIGTYQYNIALNDAPHTIEGLNLLPVKTINAATIYLRDVAHVRDGFAPQQSVVHLDGNRSVLMTILKNGAVSTLSIIKGIKEKLPEVTATLPPNLKVSQIGDQSVFVRASIESVLREGAIAATLTSLVILLFLGSWRSTIVVATSIPLSVLFAVLVLGATGQTLNIMTLGGLSLAVGILVDEATVTIENINRHLELGKSLGQAIYDGSAEIVTPAFVSMLAISIVFVPMFFLPGVSGFLFVPLALFVVFAVVGSFILSRTVVPTLAMYVLRDHHSAEVVGGHRPGVLARLQKGFERGFERVRAGYGDILAAALGRRRLFVLGFLGAVAASLAILPLLGSNFFPTVDAGQIALHVRVPVGSRIEDSAAQFDRIERRIRTIIPPGELAAVVDNIGLAFSAINVTYNNSGTVGPQDGDILISLTQGHHPTEGYVKAMREQLPRAFPGSTFAFLPADITSQILNFGAPAPIDIQVVGKQKTVDMALAETILRRIRAIPGVTDARIQQSPAYPELKVDIDRAQIGQYGLTERNVTTSVQNVLAGSWQTQPTFYLNPQNGVSYPIAAQAPEYRVRSLDDLANLPVTGAGNGQPQILGGLARIQRDGTDAVLNHYDIAPMVDVYAGSAGRDLGAVATDINKVLDQVRANAPKGTKIVLRGQFATMTTAFNGLFLGLAGAVLLIYLLIVVNFQSWLDPLVIITALPGAIAGIIWMLFLTGTTLSVPALTGAIMCMGVATANSVLLVSFARTRLEETGDAIQSALEAGLARFRPVIMTASAMIIGMVPMALSLGEGSEQNAPLGRAVIGGLLVATFATLLFVPVIFSIVHRKGRVAAPAFQTEEQYHV
jgi:CzcA family heavy metal efflux pump